MFSDAVWKRDASGVEHPSREAILAFIREQCAEHEKNLIDEHLLADCVSCNQIYTGLKQESNLLNQLYDVSHRPNYPELQSNQILLHMQRGVPLTSAWTGKRKRKFQVRNQLADRHLGRRTGLRVFRFSFPVAFGILCLFTTVAIVLAYGIVERQSQLSGPVNTTPHVLSKPTTIIPHQTPTATITITPGPELTASPSPMLASTIIKGAKLAVCGWSQATGSIVPICGHGFKGVSKVWLEIEDHAGNSRLSGPYFINSAGYFEAVAYGYCKNPPTIIYAVNKAQKPLSLPLTYTSRAGCYVPNPNVTPGSYP